MFMASFNATVDSYRMLLANVGCRPWKTENWKR